MNYGAHITGLPQGTHSASRPVVKLYEGESSTLWGGLTRPLGSCGNHTNRAKHLKGRRHSDPIFAPAQKFRFMPISKAGAGAHRPGQARSKMIEPHGGKLANRLAAVRLDAFELSDLEMLAIGGFSPLEGFIARADYEAVVHEMHPANGLPSPLPVTLAALSDEAAGLSKRSRVALAGAKGRRLGVLAIEDIFRPDREEEARHVFPPLRGTASSGTCFVNKRRGSQESACKHVELLVCRDCLMEETLAEAVPLPRVKPMQRAAACKRSGDRDD
jgi:pseudouridine/archaeosine synthase-like protein